MTRPSFLYAATIALSFLLFNTGCAHRSVQHRSRSAADHGVNEEVAGSADEVSQVVSSSDISGPLEKKTAYTSKYGEIKESYNRHVRKWVSYFQGRGRRHMERYLSRSTRYLPMMQRKLREEGLPEDLIYIVFIESGFNQTAHSHANAVGYWQFISGTGRRYGLKINGYIDERRDPVLSTEAAAGYFKALYNLFGDWYLAMAAYNTGENRVKRAVMRYGTRDFWKLNKRRRLHRETRNYIPKFLAARLIAKDPERYGFNNISYEAPLNYDTYKLEKPISLKKLASHLGISLKQVKRLNPRYRTDHVPVYRTLQRIRLPKGYRDVAVAAIDKSFSAAPKYIVRDHMYYRVRRGDTLSGIAQKFRTRVSNIRRLNRLGRRSFIRIGQKLKVPDRYGKPVAVKKRRPSRAKVRRAVARQSSNRRSARSSKTGYHRVRRGENLSLIAKRYGTSVHNLKRWNKFNRKALIRAGQKIRVRPFQSGKRVHVVRRGENLSTIARRYSTTVHKIASANALANKSRIFIGLKLVIP